MHMVSPMQAVLGGASLLVAAGFINRAATGSKLSSSTSEESKFLSWRVAVETNNVRGFRTIPRPFLPHVERYMIGGQYERDFEMVVDQIDRYVHGITVAGDGRDAWVFDVDDTCLSNLPFMRMARFGVDPVDINDFWNWNKEGKCPAIPSALRLYKELLESGFKVFLLTGREEAMFRPATVRNLEEEGFLGYERLIMRSPSHKDMGAVEYKSTMRRQLVAEGYRIRGNVGDQWSDLSGDCVGDRTFKVPNPIYYVS